MHKHLPLDRAEENREEIHGERDEEQAGVRACRCCAITARSTRVKRNAMIASVTPILSRLKTRFFMDAV